MSLINEKVKEILAKACKSTGKSEAFILGASGVNAAQYYNYIKDDRPFSDGMMRAIGESDYFDISYIELKALKLIEKHPKEEILAAVRFLDEEESRK